MLLKLKENIQQKLQISIVVISTQGVLAFFNAFFQFVFRKILQLVDFVFSLKFRRIKDYNYRIVYYRLHRKRIKKGIAKSKIQSIEEQSKIVLFIICPVNNPVFLHQTLKSLNIQFFCNFEVFILISSEQEEEYLQKVPSEKFIFQIKVEINFTVEKLKQYVDKNTNKYFAFIEEGDCFEPNAFFEIVQIFNSKSKPALDYSDEDTHSNGNDFSSPFFKPDYSPHYLNSYPYIGNAAFYRGEFIVKFLEKEINVKIHQLTSYLNLFVNYTNFQVTHIADVLFHGYKPDYFEPKENNNKNDYFEMLSDFYKAIDLYVTVNKGKTSDTFRVGKQISNEKLVSIIIPFKDKVDLLKKCVESIFDKPAYANFELILVSNNSIETATFSYLDSISEFDDRISIYKYDIPFNFSKLNNWAAKKAKGEYLLFLNNDTEVIDSDWLVAMVEQLMFEKVGAVGAKLLYPNQTVQHAGVVTGFGGCADHVFLGFNEAGTGYFNRLNCINNYSICSAACLLVKKSLFEQTGGFDEQNLTVAFNDVDLCLKIRDAGYYIVYTPFATLYHHESVSRGKDETKEEIRRFTGEVEFIKSKWRTHQIADPFYNPNLTLMKTDFSLKI